MRFEHELDEVRISGRCTCDDDYIVTDEPATIATVRSDAIKVWFQNMDGKFWFMLPDVTAVEMVETYEESLAD